MFENRFGPGWLGKGCLGDDPARWMDDEGGIDIGIQIFRLLKPLFIFDTILAPIKGLSMGLIATQQIFS